MERKTSSSEGDSARQRVDNSDSGFVDPNSDSCIVDLSPLEREEDTATNIQGIQPHETLDFLPATPKLLVLQGPGKGQVFYLEERRNTIGRSSENTVCLTGGVVSLRHAAICFSKAREWRIEDMGSKNGTLLNGTRVKEFAIRNGDKVLIGDHLLQFVLGQTPTAPAEPAAPWRLAPRAPRESEWPLPAPRPRPVPAGRWPARRGQFRRLHCQAP